MTVEIGPHRPVIVIGRNDDCTVRVLENSISRYHAVIRFQNGFFTVNDPPEKASVNGIFINGHRKPPYQEVQLPERCEVRCGAFPLYFMADGAQLTPSPNPPMSTPGHGSGSMPAYPSVSGGTNPGLTNPGIMPGSGGYPGYPPQPLPMPAVAGMPTTTMTAYNPAELDQLRRENEILKLQREEIEDEVKTTRQELDKQKRMIVDRERGLTELERRLGHTDTIISSLNDQLDRLKEQNQLQREQVDSYRADLKDRDDRIEDLSFKLKQIQEQAAARGASAAGNEHQINDLKIQVSQRDRRLDEMRRELDLAQYELKEERGNVERLEMMIRQLNQTVERLERNNRDLQRILEERQ
jgi:hypothetical protein